jgi:hypothetical protein
MHERRSFLKGLLALGALAAGGGLEAERPAAARPLVLRAAVRGHRYHAGPRVLHRLAPGDALHLVREPLNAYDENAVAVHWNGAQLGYLPREHNQVVATLLDQGVPLEARLVQVDAGEAWEPCEVEVRLAA